MYIIYIYDICLRDCLSAFLRTLCERDLASIESLRGAALLQLLKEAAQCGPKRTT